MKKNLFILAFLLPTFLLQAQKADIEIAQSLITKNHSTIREGLYDLGLSFVQKKQSSTSGNEMKYIFLIDGTKNNKKYWDIYTETISDDSIRVKEIVIKYYYKNHGDIIELDKFKKQQDQIVGKYFISYEKSEGTKQAHIKITSQELFDYSNSVIRSDFLKFASSPTQNLYLQLFKEIKEDQPNVYYVKVYVEDLYTCVGLPNNLFVLELENGKSVTLKEENTSDYCAVSPESNFYFKKEDVELLKENGPIKLRLIQDKAYGEYKVNNPQLLSKLLNLIDE
jgi:hypothetical protein